MSVSMFRQRCYFISILSTILASYWIYSLSNTLSARRTVLSSSAFCSGSTNVDRQCVFKNIYFRPDIGQFVFVYDEDNTEEFGVPENRFNPWLVDLSTVANHNKFTFSYVEVLASSFRTFEKKFDNLIRVVEPTILHGRFKPDNLMHLLHDDILPLLATVNKLKLASQSVNILFHDSWQDLDSSVIESNPDWYNLSFKLATFKHTSDFDSNSLVVFEQLHVGLTKDTLWYDYGFFSPQRPIPKSSTQKRKLRKTIVAFTDLLSQNCDTCREKFAALISRKTSRVLTNENEVVNLIQNTFQLNTVLLDIQAFSSIQELVQRLKCVDLLIGMHGSALALAMFLEQGSSVIELFPYAVVPERYTPYKTICQLQNVNYFAWVNENISNTVTHPDFPRELGGISHISDDEKVSIAEATEVPEHLCCDDPNWLFHAYQDTKVDIEPLRTVLARVQISNQSRLLFDDKHWPHLHPGPVESAICSEGSLNGQIIQNISWVKPWNLEFVNVAKDADVKYEVISKYVAGKTSQAYVTTETYLALALDQDSHVWIRCQLSHQKGPFSRAPILCKPSFAPFV
ncbi:Protein O-linked-mannose beta-1,4-N-acetylglucosaminyltransferase 2 [Halotydeus destructor]|nr:Protein O-linked-mannose beta-1,4-N-acetylglucosaminyltransferase 2 [Halotydeus destructor]